MDIFSGVASTFGVIFAIVDPFGVIPIFVAMTAKDSQAERKRMLRTACATAFTLLTIFTLVGKHLITFLGITIPAIQISGGLILLVIAFEMLKVLPIQEKLTPHEENEARSRRDISIVPLAIPMLSGPASLATVIMFASEAKSASNFIAVIVSIFLTMLLTYLILRQATLLQKLIGITGINVLTRVMGMFLCAMAVQFILDGYRAFS